MSDAQARLNQVKDVLTFNRTATTIPFDPDCTKFPLRKDVPRRADAPPEAAWVWGENDQVILLLYTCSEALAHGMPAWSHQSPYSRESESCGGGDQDWREDILEVCHESRSLTHHAHMHSLPLNEPEVPAFHRETFKHEIKDLAGGLAFDDLYTLNTQSGTQWDGFRHVFRTPLPMDWVAAERRRFPTWPPGPSTTTRTQQTSLERTLLSRTPSITGANTVDWSEEECYSTTARTRTRKVSSTTASSTIASLTRSSIFAERTKASTFAPKRREATSRLVTYFSSEVAS